MKFLAAAIQMLATDDKAANLKEAKHWLRRAAAQGARVAALPEVFIWRGNKKSERESAEPIPGPSSNALAELARELGIYVLAGSILEAIPASPKAYNTSLLFEPSGKVLAAYRKIHLFDVDLANGMSLRESATREFGTRVAVADMGFGKCRLVGVLRSAVSRALSRPSQARRGFDLRSVRLHGIYWRSALGNAAARPRDRKPSLHNRAGSVRQKRQKL